MVGGWGDFLPENILKRRLNFYEGFMGGSRESGGTKLFFEEGGVDMEIFV